MWYLIDTKERLVSETGPADRKQKAKFHLGVIYSGMAADRILSESCSAAAHD